MNDSDLDAVLDLLRPGMRVYVPGGCAEPTPLIAALRQRPEAASGITFVGIWIPGINQIDFCSLHPTAKMETIFLPPELHASHQAGRVLFRPMGYRNAWTWLLERSDIDLAFLTLSPGGSAGLCADFTQAAARAARQPAKRPRQKERRAFNRLGRECRRNRRNTQQKRKEER